MKAAFITGSTGFLGLNLIEVLSKGEWEIHALHLPGEDLHYLSKFNVNPVAVNIIFCNSLKMYFP